MNKKFLIISLSFIVILAIVGCKKKTDQLIQSNPVNLEVPETGRVIDISDKEGQEVTVTAGDILYLKLASKSEKGYQWLTISPAGGDCLTLKDQKVDGLAQPNATSTTFQWWLKVQKFCLPFNLQFDYVKMKGKAKDSFKIKVIGQNE